MAKAPPERLAAALRANLRRRKAHAASGAAEPAPGPGLESPKDRLPNKDNHAATPPPATPAPTKG